MLMRSWPSKKMQINEDKLPIKYILGIEKELPGYPGGFDILVNEVRMCSRNPDRYKGSFTLHALKTYRFPETEIEQLKESMQELVELGLVEQTNSDEGKEAWKILINPFE
jgi:hypothetical protein